MNPDRPEREAAGRLPGALARHASARLTLRPDLPFRHAVQNPRMVRLCEMIDRAARGSFATRPTRRAIARMRRMHEGFFRARQDDAEICLAFLAFAATRSLTAYRHLFCGVTTRTRRDAERRMITAPSRWRFGEYVFDGGAR